MILLGALVLLSIGIYGTLLGLGKINTPIAWQNRDEALWIGRFSLFFGFLMFVNSQGLSTHQISDWLQDILTSGGGGGAG